ncbi:MAG: GNVR domain-containing protein [Gammaproteobacteria bacterium]
MNQKDLYNDSEPNQINLGRFIRLILLQSKLIFAITLAGAIVGLTSYFVSTKTYEISSLLQVYSPNQSFDPRQSLNLDFFNAPETNLDNLVTLYSSRSNILELIKGLSLNLKINNSDDKKLIDITTFFVKKNEEYDEKIFYLEIQNNSFLLLDDKKNVLIEGLNGEYLENDHFEIQLNFPNLSSKKLIQITYTNPSDLYNFYKNKLSLINLGNSRNFWSQEGLIEISLLTDDISKGMNIINLANNIFIKDNIKVETEKARTSMVFIDSQLNNLEEILNVRKSELQNFKQENKSLDVNLEVQSIIEMISDVEQNINKVDLEISKAEINFTRDNPLYLNLKTQKEALVLQRNKIEQKIKNLPEAQQEYVDLFTNLEVSEKLYSELINRRLNFSLMEASSIGNIRVVDKAYVKDFVGPRISLVFIFTMICFFLGVITAIFRGIFFISISNPAELQDVGIKEKIVGVLSHCENPDDLFLGDDNLKQSVETTILNIETMISKSQDLKKLPEGVKILISSPTPGNGKSFFSRALSEGLTQIGHKVLLIDADLKRGIQHKIYNKESIEIKSFQDISLEKIDEYKIKDNFYLIPKIKKIKNTFELLYSDSFLDKINEFQTFFDYIIIDTAPVLNVSDTGLLMTNSDINLLVVRHQLTRTNEISQAKQIIEQIGRAFDGIIYNDYQKPKGYYGYYDLYGDYSYRYYAERYLYDDYYSEKDD